MPKPIMVLSSDWHISPYSWKKHPKIQKDSYYSLQQIVDLAIKLNVPLIGAGDLFDIKNPPSDSVIFCVKQMQRLAKVNLPVYYVQGQHELSENPWMNLCENAVHIDSFKAGPGLTEFEIKGLRVVGQDIEFSAASFLNQCRAFYEKANNSKYDLYVTHQVWADFIQKRDESFMFKNATFAKIIYTGDMHKTDVLTVNGTKCLSSGSINMQASNESPHKYVFVLYDDLSFKEHELKTRPFWSFEVKSEEDLNNLLNVSSDDMLDTWPHRNLPSHIQTPLVCVRYQNSIPNGYELLVDKFKDWNYEILPTDFQSEEVVAAVDRKRLQDLVDISECVEQTGFSKETAAHQDAVRIFNSVNVEEELKQMRKEHLEEIKNAAQKS